MNIGPTIQDPTDFLDREKLARFCWLAGSAHPSKPSTEENREDHILNISRPQVVVSASVS
jgi:hypothetical protein